MGLVCQFLEELRLFVLFMVLILIGEVLREFIIPSFDALLAPRFSKRMMALRKKRLFSLDSMTMLCEHTKFLEF